MTNPFKFPRLILLAAVLFSATTAVQAQSFGLSVTSSASSLLVSNTLTYTINVTNLNALVGDLQNATVTNRLPDSVLFLNASSTQGTITNYQNVVVFTLGTFIYGLPGAARLTVTAQPLTAGLITNTVLVASEFVTNTASTNVVVQVTNPPPILADLGVGIAAPTRPVITNDFTGYELDVTNFGPSTASAVSLTNPLPAGVILQGASRPYTLSGGNLIFNLGPLTNGGRTRVEVSLQPTNATGLSLVASVGAAGSVDTNTVNNTATNSLDVIGYLPGTLLAVTNSPQTLNLQNGLTEQSIQLSNMGTNDVSAVRVVVTGLTKQLFNAAGTNNGNPFVVYSSRLAAGKSVSLLLQYAPRGNFPFTNSQLQAFAVPLPDLSPPTATVTSTNLSISRIVQMANGNMLIEFPAVSNRTYTVVYSDNVLFSNAMIAPPAVVAPANRVQWIDYGPPTTVSAPTNSTARFYRVLQNP
jgi:uncharacterized repeat protein (TIGR01451 family)